jgi:CRP-like cAMP-binding protein
MANRFIQKLQGFAELSEREIGALEQATSQAKSFSLRQHLIREGDSPGPVFVMIDGWAIRYKLLPAGTRQIMAFLMPGDACDLHIGMLAEMDHSIETITPASVVIISPGSMVELMDNPGIARAMYISQLIDEGTLRAWIVSLGRRSSLERAAHLLLELYLRAIRVGLITGGEMELPLTQNVIADALGMTPVHMNRILQQLRRSGAIELRRGRLTIPDPAPLVGLSGFDDNYLHRRLRTPPGMMEAQEH